MVEERTLIAKEQAGPPDYFTLVRENVTILLSPDEDCQLTVEWCMEKGDEWDITIYQSPPEGQLQLVLTYGLIAGFGMILLLVTSVSYGIHLGKEDETAKRPE